MELLTFLLYVAAFICFVIEVWRTRAQSLLALGLALWVLVNVIGTWPG